MEYTLNNVTAVGYAPVTRLPRGNWAAIWSFEASGHTHTLELTSQSHSILHLLQQGVVGVAEKAPFEVTPHATPMRLSTLTIANVTLVEVKTTKSGLVLALRTPLQTTRIRLVAELP